VEIEALLRFDPQATSITHISPYPDFVFIRAGISTSPEKKHRVNMSMSILLIFGESAARLRVPKTYGIVLRQ